MALWDDFSEQNPGIADDVRRLQESILQLRDRGLEGESALYRELGVPGPAAEILADPATVPVGIFGTGAWLSLSPPALSAAVFVRRGLAPLGGAALERSALGPLFQTREGWVSDVLAVPLDQPQRFSAWQPGDPITVGSRIATVGVSATCLETDGLEGFLTAGHAAPEVGVTVRDDRGSKLGVVERTLPAPPLSLSPTADVAFVATVPGSEGLGSPVTGHRSVRAGERVTLQTSRGPSLSFIRGLSPEFWVDPHEPPWGDVAITANALSHPGDSGAPLFADDNFLVGLLVGGTREDYSVIQDIEYQLGSIRVRVS